MQDFFFVITTRNEPPFTGTNFFGQRTRVAPAHLLGVASVARTRFVCISANVSAEIPTHSANSSEQQPRQAREGGQRKILSNNYYFTAFHVAMQ